MKKNIPTLSRIARGANPGLLVLGVVCIGLLAMAPAADAADLLGLTVIGVAPDGTETILTTDYRWLVEEDQTYHVPVNADGSAMGGTNFDPNWQQGSADDVGGETLSVSFHDSYMPVVAKGCVGDDAWQTAAACSDVFFPSDPGTKRYYVSVVPRDGYSIGGAEYVPGTGATVYVNQWNIPTAQISVLVFHDNFPINNAPDLPGETPGLEEGQTDMSGFQIVVEDGGGRYGASAGVQSQDAFGNPLGTTYDVAGNPTGFSPLITGPDGRISIKNLAPGKYGIQAVPPAGSGWQQTATIEGTKIIDTWVEANEPPFFAEFGPPGFHAFIGFVKDFNEIPAGGGPSISGNVVNQHMSRPPDYAFYNGACFGHTTPWVGLNDLSVGIGKGIYAAPTGDDCSFSIPNVPDGNYQLVFWDNNMDLIFAFKGISIVAGECSTTTGCDLGEVPVFQWFHRQEHFVYNDINGDGVYDGSPETPILEQGLNLRWRDGTVYQGNVSDPEGLYAFDQVFPFFSWLVAEVDFLRFEATSLTVVVDNGGPIPGLGAGGVPGPSPEDDLTFGGVIAPQDQTNEPDLDCTDPAVCTETTDYRIDLGPVLTAGFQGFLGQTNAFQWGKRHYADGENGGISGIVFYAITRAENDPELAAAEPWEPGIPGVTVNLYESGGVDPITGEATLGTLLTSTTTDSWDDSIPTGCKLGNDATDPFSWSPDGINFFDTDCYDGLRVFNQVRPAVFDGGYAFGPRFDCAEDFAGTCPTWLEVPDPDANIGYLIPGDYIVEMIAPVGYEILKPEDKNVDFGDVYDPVPELLPAPCVGELAMIPDYLTLFPDEMIGAPFAGTERPLCDRKLVTLSAGANAAADFWAFTEVPVAAHATGFILDDTQNEFDPNSPNFGEKYAPPFVPITIRDWTGRIIGKTLSDQYGTYNFLAPSTITTNLPAPSGMSPNMLTTCMNDEGDPENPDPNYNPLYSTFCYTFQYMPGVTTYLDTPVVPVAAFTGPDQFPVDCEFPDGTPRIWSADVQTNLVGGGPYMPTTDAINYCSEGGNVCTKNNDCTASGQDKCEPGVSISGDQTITITSMGLTQVTNPNYCNSAAGACPGDADTINKDITRDFGFGATQGTLVVGDLPVTINTWTDTTITATVPADTSVGTVGGRQLTVTRSNGEESVAGITVQVGLRAGASVISVSPDSIVGATPIQNAIGTELLPGAGVNDLILVAPGDYNELVVMWKPVQLQGWGEGSTTINAVKTPSKKLEDWRGLVDWLVDKGKVDLLPGQEAGGGPPEPATLQTEEGAGVLVLARAGGGDAFDEDENQGARIDGFTIKSADTGGGIILNGFADRTQISNNRVSNNAGFFGGGIRVGHPSLVAEANMIQGGCPDGGATCYTDADNDWVNIHHNQVVFNGGFGGAGGGISMCTGSDSYRVTENWVCGNFSLRDGGGIGHTGVSDGIWSWQGQTRQEDGPIPLIAANMIVFNESFFQGATVSGGGIFVSGAQPLTPGAITPGAGNLQIIGNVIKGNSAGAGDGGGIRLVGINGQDVAANPDNDPQTMKQQPVEWYAVDVFNNMITNNVAALAGGGISMQDAVDVRIVNNTIANNDSLATAGEAFAPNSPNESTPQAGAGIVTRTHSPRLAGASGSVGTFSDPSAFADNIVWQNRQFYFVILGTPADPSGASVWGLCPDLDGVFPLNPDGTPFCGDTPVYDDIAVLPLGSGLLSPTYSLLSTTSGYVADTSNQVGADPEFVIEYVNGGRSNILQPEITTAIQAAPAFDEGGNFIRVQYGPLSLYTDDANPDGLPGDIIGDYHILATSPAVDWNSVDSLVCLLEPCAPGTFIELSSDFDLDLRSNTDVDTGADEVPGAKASTGDEIRKIRRGATGRARTGN